MGYYGGRGARKIATRQPAASRPDQPACLTDAATGLVDCGNWAASASWAVPADAVSGIYFAKLVRTDGTGGEPHRLRRPRRRRPRPTALPDLRHHLAGLQRLRRQQPLRRARPAGRAYKVSYNRPFDDPRRDAPEDFVFNAEYPMVRWLEANGYDVSYTSGVDTDRRGA